MKNIAFLIIAFLLFSSFSRSQNLNLTGHLLDGNTSKAIQGVNVVLTSSTARVKWQATATDANGYFSFHNLAAGSYELKATFVGYNPVIIKFSLKDKDIELGLIKMYPGEVKIKEITIEGKQVRAEQKGDTTVYNTDAFKTNKDATTEDLVTKLPGITVENGNVKAQGEDVKKVLIDGKEIFGDDPTIALKNMPAEIIDKIQVYDKLSDQSQFTGFDDGNTQKTMNIITKSGKSKGLFGKVYAGHGIDDKYSFGGNLNWFRGKRRISLIIMDNNINQQNFSSQDLLGISGSSPQFRGNPGMAGRQARGRANFTPPAGLPFTGSQSNFLVGQQAGINTTQSLGFNYIDQWGKKINLSFSYFFNNSLNSTTGTISRQYFLNNAMSQLYNESNSMSGNNYNHRFSLRFEYNIDSFNSILLLPRFNLQDYRSGNTLNGINSTPSGTLLSKTSTENNSNMLGNNFSNTLLFRHKFQKQGRTISLNLGTSSGAKSGNSSLYSVNKFYDVTDSSSVINQDITTSSGGFSISSDLNYTEPLSKRSILQFNYSPSWSKSNSDKSAMNMDTITGELPVLDTVLSNNFHNNTFTQRAGINYRLKGEKYNLTIGMNYQNTELNSEETFPFDIRVNKTFDNLLPSAMLQFRFSKKSNLRVFYRTSINTPSITQLQNVIENSNPLFLSAGNPELREEYRQMLVGRYGFTNTEKNRMFFAFLSAGYTSDYIGNSSFIAQEDTHLFVNQAVVAIHKGSQFTQPVNLGNNWNFNTFMTYGFPVSRIKSNLNLNAGFTYSRTPALVNLIQNNSNNYMIYSGFVLGSNISEKIDFTVTYTANYNIAKNSIQSATGNNYFHHVSTFKFNWLPWKGLVVATDLTNNLYSGLGSGYDKDIFLWNLAIGYKFLKDNAGEIRLSVFDVLNQNNSITRTVNDIYIEDNRTQVLNRYIMLSFTYSIRNFSMPKQTNDNKHR